MRSSSEIETISKRATKAAGFPWGIAEEVGKNIKNLELLSIAGIENLNLYLHLAKSRILYGPKKILNQNKLDGKSFCPFYTGSALLDSANKVLEIKKLTFHLVDFPILLIPFINRLSYKIGKKINLRIDNYNFVLNLNQFVSSNKDISKVIIENAKLVEIEVIENEDSFETSTWNKLYELSSETFVEENERLKAIGAGAGLVDND
jgi:hypothetical protein